MLIGHVSDTHGSFPDIAKNVDVIVHSGDLCPNKTRGHRETELKFQSEWIKRNIPIFKEWIGDRPFLYCMGNHDYNPYVCRTLRDNGIEAIDITLKKYTLDGVRYYGFPFIPYIVGEWNFECIADQMQREIRILKDELISGIDILVAHAPIAGILDKNTNGEHCGNNQMADLFNYTIDSSLWPRMYLHGHLHESNGFSVLEDMFISNAATVVNLIETKFSNQEKI